LIILLLLAVVEVARLVAVVVLVDIWLILFHH
jgi:hypothetical protein